MLKVTAQSPEASRPWRCRPNGQMSSVRHVSPGHLCGSLPCEVRGPASNACGKTPHECGQAVTTKLLRAGHRPTELNGPRIARQ
jgi:hypothetical protein